MIFDSFASLPNVHVLDNFFSLKDYPPNTVTRPGRLFKE